MSSAPHHPSCDAKGHSWGSTGQLPPTAGNTRQRSSRRIGVGGTLDSEAIEALRRGDFVDTSSDPVGSADMNDADDPERPLGTAPTPPDDYDSP